jgi:hypothetical protein
MGERPSVPHSAGQGKTDRPQGARTVGLVVLENEATTGREGEPAGCVESARSRPRLVPSE